MTDNEKKKRVLEFEKKTGWGIWENLGKKERKGLKNKDRMSQNKGQTTSKDLSQVWNIRSQPKWSFNGYLWSLSRQ